MFVRGRVGGGEQVFGRPLPSGKLGNFTNLKTLFPVVSLASPCQKLKKTNKKTNKKKTKQNKNKNKKRSILKEVHFWAAPPSIGHYREPRQHPLPNSHRFQGIRCGSLKIDTLTD